MSGRRKLVARLDPFGKIYYEMHAAMMRLLDHESDEGLGEIIKAAESLSTTNCGWGTYAMRDELVRESKFLLRTRAEAQAEEGHD